MLEVNKIDVFYGDVQALNQVSIRVDKGELIAIIGSNGAGKTTLLKTISGILTPRSGGITLWGERVDGSPPHEIVKRGIVHVPEGRRIFTNMTALENLEMGSYLKRAEKRKSENLKLVFEIFPVLKDRANQKAGTLSGGEQQMLAIGRGIMGDPKILMIDEPTLGLAPMMIQKLYSVLRDIKERGLTMILVEQNCTMALELADRTYVLVTGKITLEGKDLQNNEFVKKAYLGL